MHCTPARASASALPLKQCHTHGVECGATPHKHRQRPLTLLLACSPHVSDTCKAWAAVKGQNGLVQMIHRAAPQVDHPQTTRAAHTITLVSPTAANAGEWPAPHVSVLTPQSHAVPCRAYGSICAALHGRQPAHWLTLPTLQCRYMHHTARAHHPHTGA